MRDTLFPSAGSLLRARALHSLVVGALALAACSDITTTPAPTAAPSASEVKFWETGSSVAWNKTARDFMTTHRMTGAVPQSRLLTYLSVAQYNAVVAAEDEKVGGIHPSPAAAAAGASVAVLTGFFGNDAALLEERLAAQRAEAPWAGERTKEFAEGEAIGRRVGAKVLAYMKTDGVNVGPIPANPGGLGSWTGTNSLRGHYGAKTFALLSPAQFRPGPPPSFESDTFKLALAEVRAISDERVALPRPEWTQSAIDWAPRGPAYLNEVAAEMIVAKHRSEREAARILALANIAGFDVANACFDAKFAYYLIRPTQADPLITIPTGLILPNHPSYPSGHSCFAAAYATVFTSAFPEERERWQTIVVDAGMSRMYAGFHYRFDLEAGQELGRNVAEWVLRTAPRGHAPIPLDK